MSSDLFQKVDKNIYASVFKETVSFFADSEKIIGFDDNPDLPFLLGLILNKPQLLLLRQAVIDKIQTSNNAELEQYREFLKSIDSLITHHDSVKVEHE